MGYTTNLNWLSGFLNQNVEMFFFVFVFCPGCTRDDPLEVVLGSDELHSSLANGALADFSAKVHFGQLGMS